ncbi:hypothetical protein SKAU_G00048220 [Synaphobranchus kaupii]|uniref:Uncharacterized protein n=1 Tax=Synaphobranchus kaupii TaxID=118154 RepID=A0A9Q1G2H7_SYNKA|nr:hypothetical protein SKAU_G00048220 [Synaphobranchus kaupii]
MHENSIKMSALSSQCTRALLKRPGVWEMLENLLRGFNVRVVFHSGAALQDPPQTQACLPGSVAEVAMVTQALASRLRGPRVDLLRPNTGCCLKLLFYLSPPGQPSLVHSRPHPQDLSIGCRGEHSGSRANREQRGKTRAVAAGMLHVRIFRKVPLAMCPVGAVRPGGLGSLCLGQDYCPGGLSHHGDNKQKPRVLLEY